MIIGVVGSIASGKNSFVEALTAKGFINLRISNELKEIAKEKGISLERKPLQDLGNALREKYGQGFLAERVMEKITPGNNYVIDSIRNPGEIEILRNHNDFVLIGVDAPLDIRLQRILDSNKPGDPKTWEEAKEMEARDRGEGEKESGQQVSACFELSDYKLVNDGSREELNSKIALLLKDLDVLI